jgi:putative ABC transport system permease protein
MTPAPPRVAAWIASLRLGEDRREFVLGDLEEEFAARAAISAAGARRWYWRQALLCLRGGGRRVDPHSAPVTPRESFMRSFPTDLRLALRVFRRAPSFALAVAAVLALGIGANTAIFSLVNTVLLQPLPFDEPDGLVRLFHIPPQSTFPGIRLFSLSPANFLDWQRQSRSFEAMAAYRTTQFTITGTGSPDAVRAAQVGPEFFRIVRTRPALGRAFLPDEFEPGRAAVVMLSEAFWRSHFGASPGAIGQTITFDGTPFIIVGVMPARFSGNGWGATSQPVWVPLAWKDKDRSVRENHNYSAVARLAPGVTLAQAQAELATISRRLEAAYPSENAGWGGTAVPLQELIVGDVRSSLLVLLGAVALVLLIACANVGNLILARAFGRRKEIAIRAALGAGRRRVLQHLLAESIVLALAGGAGGLLLARLALTAGSALLSNQIPRADAIPLDGHVLLFALGASILTGLLAGTIPAVRAGRADVNDTLKEGGRSGDAGAGLFTRRVLIVAEVALSLMLLMGAGVMLRSLHALRAVDAGFSAEHVLTMQIRLPDARYAEPARKRSFYDALLTRLRALPGAIAAGYCDTLPATGGGSVQPIVVEGRPELKPSEQPTVAVRETSDGYMRAMEIPVRRGRDFAAGDRSAMLVSVSAAKLLWGDADPVGQRVTLPLRSRTDLVEVIGIVGDVKEVLAEKAPPTIYLFERELPFGGFSVAVRAGGDPTALSQAAVAAAHDLDPQLPVTGVRSMQTVVEDTLIGERFRAVLLEAFAVTALTLASVGIYSVLSYLVRGRRREIGIRTALGASAGEILRMVVVEGLKPAVLGVGLGVAGALAAARVLDRLVFGITASDPLTLAAVAATLLAVSIAASLLPAWRATRVDPCAVLRD